MAILKYFLFPLTLLYGFIIEIRNFLYNSKIIKPRKHSVKSIVVGNLSMGGTGKSPVTLYLATLFSEKLNVAILSRGYGRKTRGYKLVDLNSLASEVGDEPLMFKSVCGNKIQVAVCEDRNKGVEEIQTSFPKTNLIILDDAFQHRKIEPGFSILLTTFENPFFNDLILPSGSLRESRNGAYRSDLILVTKCPESLPKTQKNQYLKKLKMYNKPVFFSRIIYGDLLSFTFEIQTIKKVIVVAGIANPMGMIERLSKIYQVESFVFSDHHEYTKDEIGKIHRKFDTFASEETAIVTTQKDFMRLKDKIEIWDIVNYPWYVLPISIEIENEKEFNKLIVDYVGKN